MLVKHLIPKGLYLRQAFAFGSSIPPYGPDVTPVSKHNPDAQKELRGNHNIQQMSEAQQSISPIHSKIYKKTSAYHFCSLLSNSTARWIGQLAQNPKSAIASDCLYLPKIFEDGVPIFDSIHGVNTFITHQKAIVWLGGLAILLVSPTPTLAIPFTLLSYHIYNTFVWKLAGQMCIKAELVPQTEEIVYQKISFWGSVITRKVKISDLEQTTLYELLGEKDISERGVRGLINKEVVFKIKDSKQLLLFEKGGLWHEEGINHELLV